ncbi:jg22992 [Pararge aegeria aegeria]|uniref:Jg22992 protein n=1 Tax=Pararge aegeria aegeria TaxID=348720 RepID=A0A8S4QMR5_9NEOP|nr:jg22992 [Pararge aegeria aegeria]
MVGWRSGLKLRQLSDGRHLVQLIYTPNGYLQDCEYVTASKSSRDFIKTLRKELKLALDEESYRILEKTPRNFGDEKYYRHFGNVTFRILKNGEKLPTDVARWFNYDRLKTECFERHEELTLMMKNRNKVSENSLQRTASGGKSLLLHIFPFAPVPCKSTPCLTRNFRDVVLPSFQWPTGSSLPIHGMPVEHLMRSVDSTNKFNTKAWDVEELFVRELEKYYLFLLQSSNATFWPEAGDCRYITNT